MDSIHKVASDYDDIVQLCNKCSFVCTCEKCANCRCSLVIPFIQCSECFEVNLCMKCFARGAEISTHRNDHNYRVVQNNFVLFEDSDWTAEEELIMMDVLYMYGYGNWEFISKKLKNRSQSDIKEHYDKFYTDMLGSTLLPKVSETKHSLFRKPLVLYNFRMTDVEEPPRYAPHTMGYDSLAGYNSGRSDFEVEHDRSAEYLLEVISKSELDKSNPSYDVLCDLQYSMLLIYNRKLRERARRKHIVKKHGLILLRKTMSWMHRYEKTITRPVFEKLMRFMQCTTPEHFDKVVEGLHYASELKSRISRLCEYRKKGITTLMSAKIYEELNEQREQHKKELETFCSLPQYNWKNLLQNEVATNVPNRRGQFKPLDVCGLPGYDKLLPKEQELCKNVRLVPLAYIELRDLLIAECKKLGFLKLANARKLLKIDVNKTRKLYDFLIQEGYITKPAN